MLIAPLDRPHPQADPAEVIDFHDESYGLRAAVTGDPARPVTQP